MFDRKKYKKDAYANSKGLPKKMALASIVSVFSIIFLFAALILPYFGAKYITWNDEWFETVSNSDGYFRGESDLIEFKDGQEIDPSDYDEVGRYNSDGELVVTKREAFLDYVSSSISLPGLIFFCLFTVFAFIFVFAVGFALSRYVYQWRKCGETSLSSFIKCFSSATWRGALWYFLWTTIIILPVIVYTVVSTKYISEASYYYYADKLFPYILMILDLVFILCLVFTCAKLVSCFMMFYVLAENPKIGAVRALRLSKKMSKGCRENIFMMNLTFIVWWILTFLTLGFGLILFMPYFENSFINAYEAVKKNAIESGVLKVEDFDVLQ